MNSAIHQALLDAVTKTADGHQSIKYAQQQRVLATRREDVPTKTQLSEPEDNVAQEDSRQQDQDAQTTTL